MSDIMNTAFLSNLRRPAGLMSIGRPMRMGRPGASESKKPAIWNGRVAALTTVLWKGAQSGRS